MTSTTFPPQQARATQPDIVRRALPALLVVQAVLGLLYVALVPLWMPSDERAHMRYIMDLAATGHLPIMRVGDPSYETHQPPLFYAVAALPYLLLRALPLSTIGYVLRSFCFLFQMLSTVLVADIFRRHLPTRPFLALASLVFFALNPSILAINATISNDCLSFFLTVLTAWMLSRGDFRIVSNKQSAVIGVLVALGLACKLTAFPILLVALYCLLRNDRTPWPDRLVLAAFLTLPTVFLLTPWLLWNHSVYGTWTATSRLYGSSPAYAQHPNPVRSISGFSFAGIFAYHFLPSEFWLNQFKVPSWLRLELFAATLFSVIGTIFSLTRPSRAVQSYQGFLRFCFLFYALHLLVVLALDVQFSAGPVRWAFGCFFAFAFLWCKSVLKKS